MLSSALRVGYKPVGRKKTREKRVETQAPKQAQSPIEPAAATQSRRADGKTAALATAAVGAHIAVLSPFLDTYTNYMLMPGTLFGSGYLASFGSGVLAIDGAMLVSLLVSGWLFFKRQQRVPLLLNALAWIVLEALFQNPDARVSWPCITAAICTLVVALALGRKNPKHQLISSRMQHGS